MIILKNFKKIYSKNIILDIKCFRFFKGKSYLIIGKNGSGKSTLIKCMLGINNINNGCIVLNTKNIGYIPEKYFFPEFCTVNKFLKTILDLYKKEKNIDLIDFYCERFLLDKSKLLSKLSKGMKQKVLIIQALLHDADIFIFDEPLNGLDDYSQNIFFEIIEEIKKMNKTLLITTHYPSLYGDKYDYYVKIENKGITNESN